MSDRVHEQIVEALRQALAQPGEHRLYRAGKLTGLFAGRSGAAGDAAARAIREELLEVVRTETRGKATVEWVRITPRGVDFLHTHESPLAVLRELRDELAASRDGIPRWLDDLAAQWRNVHQQMVEQMQQTQQRLDALAQRVEEALRRADALGPAVPEGVAETVPWSTEALSYLDRRKEGGGGDACPLPELFAAVRRNQPGLSLIEFQHGLRRLGDHKALRLLPFTGPADQLPEPEYALLDGAEVLYYAAR